MFRHEMISGTPRRKLALSLLAGVLFLLGSPALSAACSLCYSSAKATSAEGQRAFGKGIILLIVPSLGFMSAGISLAFRYGAKRDLECL